MNNVRAKNLSLKIRFEWSLSGYEVGSIADFPLPVADEGNALMAQWPEIRRAPLAGVCLDSGATSVAPYVLWLNETWQTTYLLQGVRSSNLRWLIKKNA